MRIPATKQVEGTRFAIAVWRDEHGTWRYRVTHGECFPAEYRDPRDGWAPMEFKVKSAYASAYMATRDADPPELVETLRKALLESHRVAVRLSRASASQLATHA